MGLDIKFILGVGGCFSCFQIILWNARFLGISLSLGRLFFLYFLLPELNFVCGYCFIKDNCYLYRELFVISWDFGIKVITAAVNVFTCNCIVLRYILLRLVLLIIGFRFHNWTVALGFFGCSECFRLLITLSSWLLTSLFLLIYYKFNNL